MAVAMDEALLALVETGWRVFPCHPDGAKAKQPLTPHGFKDASGDRDQVWQWWKRWPNAMVGAAVDDRLVVLDIDPRHDGSVAALERAARVALPPTVTCWSGRNDGGCRSQRPGQPLQQPLALQLSAAQGCGLARQHCAPSGAAAHALGPQVVARHLAPVQVRHDVTGNPVGRQALVVQGQLHPAELAGEVIPRQHRHPQLRAG